MKTRLILLFLIVVLWVSPVYASEPWSGDWLIPTVEVTENVTANVTQEWKSVTEIRKYVKATGIPGMLYVPDKYDCENFAIALTEQARLDGRVIGLYLKLIYKDGEITAHMKNFAIVGNYVYQIEPQNGNVGPLDGWNVKLD